MDDISGLKALGKGKTDYAYDEPSSAILEAFPNKYPQRNYVINLEFAEFTSLCPMTGQPDFASIRISYCPDALCLETKSIKLYFFAYRNHGSFMETITNRILDDCVEVCKPRWMIVKGIFRPRGGICLDVEARYAQEGARFPD